MRADRELILLPQELVRDRSMGNRHALGLSGGSRSVDRVRDVVRSQAGEAFAVPNRCCVVSVQIESFDVHDVELPVERIAGSAQNNCGRCRFEDVSRAFCRLIRVERNVGPACLHHRVHGNDQFDGAPQIERDSHFRADTDVDQIPCQAVAFGVELGVGQATVTENQRFGARCSAHLGVEQIREGRLWNDSVGVVPRVDGGRDLFVAEQSDVAYREVRVSTDRIENAKQTVGECRHCGWSNRSVA